MKFQEPTESDLSQIVNACERDAETTLYDSIILRYAKKNKLKVFLFNEQPVGFIIEEVIYPEAELIQIFVFSEYRNAGFGKMMLRAWTESLVSRKIERMFLEVRDGNIAATKLYKLNGFAEVGRRKNYYQLNLGTFDAILMDKVITLT